MPKYTVWRSGTAHMNNWNAKPCNWGEYEADTFLDACQIAFQSLHNFENWKSEIIDGVMFIESDEVRRFGLRLGRFGLYQTKEEALAETKRRFDRENAERYAEIMELNECPTELKCWERALVPQIIFDSFNRTSEAYACLEKWDYCVLDYNDDPEIMAARRDKMMHTRCDGCLLREPDYGLTKNSSGIKDTSCSGRTIL